MGFIALKCAKQQTALMLIGMRERLVKKRTRIANAIHDYASQLLANWPDLVELD